MNLKQFSKDFLKLFMGLLLVVILVAVWNSHSSKAGIADTEEFYSRVRDGVGREVPLAETSSDALVVNSVDSLSRFMSFRAGIEMSDTNKQLLTRLEKLSLSSPDKGITPTELVDVITTNILTRLAKASDQQIADIANVMSGFDHPDLPPALKNKRFAKLRGHYITKYNPQQFAAEITKIAKDSNNPVYRTMISTFINNDVQSTLNYTSAAGVRIGATDRKLSPVRAFLIAYSAITDDQLCDSSDNLTRSMFRTQYVFSQHLGNYPSPQGLKAYGRNGYFVSMPSEFFDDAAQTQLLRELSKRVY